MDTEQIELLDKNKRRILFALWVAAAFLLVISVFRFVPRVNDALSGKPQYLRVLTETFARQFANQTQRQFPLNLHSWGRRGRSRGGCDSDGFCSCLRLIGSALQKGRLL